MVLTHPVCISVVFAKSRSSSPLEARPTGQRTHSAMPIARIDERYLSDGAEKLKKEKSNRIVTHFGRTFHEDGFTVRTLHKAEKALLIISSEINGDDSETNEPDNLDEEDDEDEELQESNNLPPADTRILSEIPTSPMQGFAEDSVEPSRLRKRCLPDDDSIQNVCEDDGCRAEISERELLRCDAPGCDLTVSWIKSLSR